MRCPGWCGWCYCGAKGRATRRGHYGWRSPRKVRPRVALRKPVEGPAVRLEGQTSWEAQGDPLQAAYPQITEFLTAEVWEDGSSRQTATLTVFWEDARWKLCLNDRAVGRTGWVSGRSLSEALVALEAGLLEDDLDWRRKGNRKK